MKSYRISPKEWLSAFSTAENRLCRTLVRRRDDFRRFCIFFISRRYGSAKIVRNEKAKTSCINRLLVCSYLQLMCRNPDGFLHKILRFRFFYRRKSPLPYNCTATWRFSTILHLFYLSPVRKGLKSADRKSENKFLNDGFSIINILVTGRNSDGFLYKVICFHFF